MFSFYSPGSMLLCKHIICLFTGKSRTVLQRYLLCDVEQVECMLIILHFWLLLDSRTVPVRVSWTIRQILHEKKRPAQTFSGSFLALTKCPNFRYEYISTFYGRI